jgi:hypothetical protein
MTSTSGERFAAIRITREAPLSDVALTVRNVERMPASLQREPGARGLIVEKVELCPPNCHFVLRSAYNEKKQLTRRVGRQAWTCET